MMARCAGKNRLTSFVLSSNVTERLRPSRRKERTARRMPAEGKKDDEEKERQTRQSGSDSCHRSKRRRYQTLPRATATSRTGEAIDRRMSGERASSSDARGV